MKLNENGFYETTKRIAFTGDEIVGQGKTREAAREDLKSKLKAYRGRPPFELVATFNSPGYGEMQDQNGNPIYDRVENRQAAVWARPSLAPFLREERKKAADAAKAAEEQK